MAPSQRPMQDYQNQLAKLAQVKLGGDPDPNQSYPDLNNAQQRSALAAAYNDQETHQAATSLSEQAGEMERKSAMFATVTRMMGQLNESINANTYIRDTLKGEIDRERRLNSEARREVLKTQQRHLSESYNKNSAAFSARMIVFTVVFTALLGALVGGWVQGAYAPWMFYVAAILLIVIYIIVLSVLLGNYTQRRKLHWDQYYWGSPEKKEEQDDDACPDDE